MICKDYPTEYLLPTSLLKLKVINFLLQLPRTLEPNNPSGSQHHILTGAAFLPRRF